MDPVQIFSLTGDDKVQSVLGKLKFLSKIRQGEKVNCKDLFVRDNDSILQRFLRTIKNTTAWASSSEIVESKEATLSFIQDTINSAITQIIIYRKESDDDFKQSIANLLVENLEHSKIGIQNIIFTYKNDRNFICDIEAVIQTLEARINSMLKHGYMDGISSISFMPKLETDM